tara:strand:+ start:24 stop:245 length:222 start_codon:yes stop_codon:yes gene_type:complete
VIRLKIRKVRNPYPKTDFPFSAFSSNSNKGRKAKKIRGKTPIDVQENANNNPLDTAASSFFIVVTNIMIFLLI